MCNDKLIQKMTAQKFTYQGKRLRIAKAILQRNRVGKVVLPNFRTYPKATAVKIVWYWWKTCQWNTVTSTDPHVNDQLIGTEMPR